MPSVRAPLECTKPLLKNVKGVLYSRRSRKPVPVNVPTAIHPTRDCMAVPRFPSFEAILGLDTELHETWVSYQDDLGKVYRFLIAAQYNPNGEVNEALRRLAPQVSWRGDLLVMRGGATCFVVHMGDTGHRVLAERAVCKFLLQAANLVARAVEDNVDLVLPTEM
ncbi:hypothetical protein FKP32DRAFT_1580004 [Trametes sanguinea]|nr:hypothetical protein FKP32DRAFT_1580004 [Trametes sanguinea]